MLVLSAGVERQFFSGDRPAGSQRGAEQPEEKQHQQLQRQPHLAPSGTAGLAPPGPERRRGCSPSCTPEGLRSGSQAVSVLRGDIIDVGKMCRLFGAR